MHPELALKTSILVPKVAYMTFVNSKLGPDTASSYNTYVKHGAYVYYKICPKMSVEL
jgi:hypothetical protein